MIEENASVKPAAQEGCYLDDNQVTGSTNGVFEGAGAPSAAAAGTPPDNGDDPKKRNAALVYENVAKIIKKHQKEHDGEIIGIRALQRITGGSMSTVSAMLKRYQSELNQQTALLKSSNMEVSELDGMVRRIISIAMEGNIKMVQAERMDMERTKKRVADSYEKQIDELNKLLKESEELQEQHESQLREAIRISEERAQKLAELYTQKSEVEKENGSLKTEVKGLKEQMATLKAQHENDTQMLNSLRKIIDQIQAGKAEEESKS